MKLFNPGGERGSAMSYAALLEKIEIMRSTLRWLAALAGEVLSRSSGNTSRSRSTDLINR